VVAATPATTLPAKNEDTTVLVVGPTGYIGRYVTKELIARGYKACGAARQRACALACGSRCARAVLSASACV
jgi:nucleoside-diphosphate-sugar epimerase